MFILKLLLGVVLAIVGGIYAFVWNLKRIRKRDLQPGMPGPPMPSLLWGHLMVMKELADQFPKGAHGNYYFEKLTKDLNFPPFFRVDLRPFAPPLIVVADGDYMDEIVRAKNFTYGAPKGPEYLRYSNSLGAESMLMTNDEVKWKQLRKTYNPGFQPQHLRSLIPSIGRLVTIVGDIFQTRADAGEPVDVMEYFVRLTFDVIGLVTAETDLGILGMDGDRSAFGARMYTNFVKMLQTYENEDDTPFELDPMLKLRRWWHSRQWDKDTKQLILDKMNTKLSPRSILGLTFAAEPKYSLQAMADNLKTFLFAGHDTTAITALWAFYYIYTMPSIHSKFIKEIEAVYGLPKNLTPSEQTSRILSMICESPEKTVYAMPYTSAILKETLRVHSPAGASRYLNPSDDAKLRLRFKSHDYSVAGHTLYCNSHLAHLNTQFWGEDAAEFKPERWFTEFGQKAEQSNWYRPFEKGPKSCIGKELATLEIMMVLAMLGWRWDGEVVGHDVSKGEPLVTRRVTAKPLNGILMRFGEREI